MWKPEGQKVTCPSENGGVNESWWSAKSSMNEPVDGLLSDYMQSANSPEPVKGKASANNEDRCFKARVEQLRSQSLSSPQPMGIEISTQDGHISSWSRQGKFETNQTDPDSASLSDSLTDTRNDDVVKEVGDEVSINFAKGVDTYSHTGRNNLCRDVQDQEQRPIRIPLDHSDLHRVGQSSPNPVVRPNSALKGPSPQPVNALSPVTHPPTLPSLPHPLSSSSTNHLRSSRQSLSAIQRYRWLDERQAKRAPLWRRRVSYNSSIPDKDNKMLATARNNTYDVSHPSVNEGMRYQAQHDQSYFSQREPSATDHGDLFPLSPPLSSARSSFLCASTSLSPHINGNYNLSTESLPSHAGANAMNLLSRPHSMPQLQDQVENNYNSQPRNYIHHSASHEYLSPETSFEDGAVMKPHQSLSSYSSFTTPCTIAESLELENDDSNPSSAQGSSPQPWWDQNANLELVQDASNLSFPAASAGANAFHTLPTMSPKRRFPQSNSSDNLNNSLLYLHQQPRSPIMEQERLYTNLMNRQQSNQSSIPSPPGSPGYYFSPQLMNDGFCSPTDPSGVSFIDPFNQQSSQHQAPPHGFHSLPRRTPLPKSMTMGYDVSSQSPTMPLRTVPSHSSTLSSSSGSMRSNYLRKTGSLGRSARMPPLAKTDPKEVSFVNFTPHDATKILSGVAPSGSSKTKARREREALERRRKLSEAATAAVLAAGGDPTSIPLDF